MNNKEKHFTALALILHDKKVLLVKHLKLGVWLYPGGHVENDENPDFRRLLKNFFKDIPRLVID